MMILTNESEKHRAYKRLVNIGIKQTACSDYL